MQPVNSQSKSNEYSWIVDMLMKHPDDRIRCLAFAAKCKFEANEMEKGDHLLDCAIAKMEQINSALED